MIHRINAIVNIIMVLWNAFLLCSSDVNAETIESYKAVANITQAFQPRQLKYLCFFNSLNTGLKSRFWHYQFLSITIHPHWYTYKDGYFSIDFDKWYVITKTNAQTLTQIWNKVHNFWCNLSNEWVKHWLCDRHLYSAHKLICFFQSHIYSIPQTVQSTGF